MWASNKLRIKGDEVFFGPGVRDLLLNIQKNQSIKAACHEMNLSYTKALRMIKIMEEELGFRVVLTEKGGHTHGGSRLTPQGEQMVAVYNEIEAKVDEYAQSLVESQFCFPKDEPAAEG